MKKFAILSLVVCFGLSIASSALALRWPENLSRRVGAMGGAALGIEDETTALTIFNHQNAAGIAFNKKENRTDFQLGYTSTNYELEYAPGSTVESTTTGFDFTRPGAEYRGVTYWLNDNLVMRAGVEALMTTAKTTTTPSGGTATEDGLSFSGIGGGASIAYLLDMGLAFGAGMSYIGTGGKPDDLETGSFAIYTNTTKVEMAASMLTWGVGAGFAKEINDMNKLTFGLNVAADDDMPSVAGIASGALSGGISPLALGDYNVTIETAGSVEIMPGTSIDVSTKDEYTQLPMNISFDAIYNYSTMLEAAVMVDYGMKSVNYKNETTQGTTTTEVDYKTADINELAITEAIQANIPVGEGLAILPGLYNTTVGSSNTDTFSLDITTADLNDTYKSGESVLASNTFGIGCGLQAMEKQLQFAAQYEMGVWTSEVTPFALDGTAGTVGESDGSTSAFKVGAEFWVIPMLALRAGYQMLAFTTTDGAVDSSGNVVDAISNTSRITLGAGLSLPQGMIFDLMVQLDTNTDDPASDPEPTDTAMDIFLGVKLPL